MECPHLSILDKLNTSQNLRTILGSNLNTGKLNQQPNSTRPPPSPRGTRSGRSGTTNNQVHQCNVCKSDRSPWMCVLCGQVHCGRYVNSHARKHFLENNQHFLAICCHSRAAFCYECDDYVMNETASKRLLRALEQIQNNQDTNEMTSKRKKMSNESALSSSSRAALKAKRIRLAGIRNLGNTCFMNSVLQCLSNLHRFTSSVGDPPNGKYVLDAANNGAGLYKRRLMQIASDTSKPELLLETLRNTIYQLKKSGKSFIIPESLFTMIGKNPRFRGYQQQDAHEFLRYVLDRLDKECLENRPDLVRDLDDSNSGSSYAGRYNKKTGQNHASMIGNIFGGILQNEVNCLECGFKSHKQDPFLDLSLDIPIQRKSNSSGSNNSSDVTPNSHNSDNSNLSSCNSASETTNINQPDDKPCDLMDCLLSFIELEELTETELYYCSNCQKKRRSTKRFWIRRLPDVLCLHLKRFRYNNFLRTKIDDYIQFPTQGLDMKRFVITNKHETRGSSCGPTTYDLVAFIEHHGTGLGSGHYTAYCRHDDFWFHFDDTSVRACEEVTVKQSKAYILFYNRRTV